MYKIYRGYIKDYDSIKNKDGITTYSIEMASDSMAAVKSKNFFNIAHGYSDSPENSDSLYKRGTLVYFIVDDKTGTGTILCATDKNPGRNINVLKEEEEISGIFESEDSNIPLSPGDWIKKKMDGFITILYNGLVRLRAKIGTEFILNPVLEQAMLMCKRFRLSLGNHGVVEFGLSKENGKTNFNFMIISDTTGLDIGSTLTHCKIGEHDDDRKLTLNIMKNQNPADPELIDLSLKVDGTIELNLRKDKLHLDIDPDGNINLKGKSLKFNVNDESDIELKEDGTAYVRTQELYLGQGTTDQPFMRGKDFKANYDDLLNLLKHHRHPLMQGITLPAYNLWTLLTKKLEEEKELSSTNKLD